MIYPKNPKADLSDTFFAAIINQTKNIFNKMIHFSFAQLMFFIFDQLKTIIIK